MTKPGEPETQMEYWQSIEGISGLIYETARQIRKGGIEETQEVKDYMGRWQADVKKCIAEIAEKFGVITEGQPKMRSEAHTVPAPEGKIWYWKWYDDMKRQSYSAEYEGLICSGCPLSDGLDEMIASGKIPCGVFSGSIYQLRPAWACGMLRSGGWDEPKLLEEIRAKGGEEAVAKYAAKITKLKADAIEAAAKK